MGDDTPLPLAEREELAHLRQWKQQVVDAYRADKADPIPFKIGLIVARVVNAVLRLPIFNLGRETQAKLVTELRQHTYQRAADKANTPQAEILHRLDLIEKLLATHIAQQNKEPR